MNTYKGHLERVFYSNANWASYLFRVEDNKTTIRCSGVMPPDGSAEIHGEWKDDAKYGRQLVVSAAAAIINTSTEEGLVQYLSSSVFRGIGKKLAQKIVTRFGLRTIEIIEKRPEELLLVTTKAKMEILKKNHQPNNLFLELAVYLHGGATLNQMNRLIEKYGDKTITTLKENPYLIMHEVDGFGFLRADRMALSSGMKENDPRRIAALVYHILDEQALMGGHCYLPIASIHPIATDKLKNAQVSEEELASLIAKEVREGRLVMFRGNIYTKKMWDKESNAAKIVAKYLKLPTQKNVSPNEVSIFEAKERIELTGKQKEAAIMAVNNALSVITGGPGTGKTTIIKCIVATTKRPCILVAPTGKAAVRMSEATKRPATTIHRLLLREDNLPAGPMFIVDESSMIDMDLAESLLSFIEKANGTMVFIGDIDQLPPIGAGNFFRELVNSYAVPKTVLDVTHRNSGSIAKNAARIRKGSKPGDLERDEAFNIRYCTAENIQATFVNEYIKATQKYGIKNVGALVPRRKAGTATASDSLNELIREAINPMSSKRFTIGPFRRGDRVMQTKNNYHKQVFNGDCGTIVRIDYDDDTCIVQFDLEDKEIEYTKEELSELTLAYVMTIHKSQGSEFAYAIVSNSSQDAYLLQRNLLYTAVTRAKEKVCVLGDTKGLAIAISKNTVPTRYTLFRSMFEEQLS